MLVPLVGGLHACDEEATFVLVGDYRAASWKLNCAGKNVHCFAEQESIRRQELHPNNTGIRIGPPDQVNLVDGVERQRGGTAPLWSTIGIKGPIGSPEALTNCPKRGCGELKSVNTTRNWSAAAS